MTFSTKIKTTLASIAIAGTALAVPAPASASADPLLGQLMPVGFNFCPRGWAEASGQLLPINSNQALFSLLGTTYGGDGRTTFALPNLAGRSAIGMGTGPGLSTKRIGQRGGTESSYLAVNNQTVVAVDASSENTQLVSSVDAGRNMIAVESPYLAVKWCISTQGIFPSRN